MAQRLLVVAHAPTSTTKALVFGDPGELVRWEEFRRLSGRIASWVSGPEKVCQATALRLGGTAEAIQELRRMRLRNMDRQGTGRRCFPESVRP